MNSFIQGGAIQIIFFINIGIYHIKHKKKHERVLTKKCITVSYKKNEATQLNGN